MGLQQQHVTSGARGPSYLSAEVAAAAMRYQAFHEVEAEHLARMAQLDLSLEWTPEMRQVVFNASDHVRHARDARLRFRSCVRDLVLSLCEAQEPLSGVLGRTRTMIRFLQTSGALRTDGGWIETEVLEWAIEEYENAA
jgi:hypothetical protein